MRSEIIERGWATKGGKSVPKLYAVWHSMRNRCRLPTHGNYSYYGGRGITVCDEWDDYATFREWSVSNGYGKGLSLDRIDGNGNYEPANCRWATKTEQQRNTRRKRLVTINGVTKPLWEWIGIKGLEYQVIHGRLQNGWTDEQALMIPMGEGRPPEFHKPRGRKAKCSSLHSQESQK